MSQLLNLPIVDVSKFIVVDEGADATYAENLIIAWLQTIRNKGVDIPINFLLFSKPIYQLDKHLKTANLTNYNIQDYFNIHLGNEEVDLYEHLINFVAQNINSIFVVDCLNTLVLQIGVAKSCRFIEKLSQCHKSNVFCIYRRDFQQNIPSIETLGNIYIKLKKSKKSGFQSNIHYEVSIIHRKSSGSILKWNELVQQNIENYSLQSEKISDSTSLLELKKPSEVTVQPQASFRIEMNERELKQRDSVALPYILPGNPGGKSKIIYVPDEVDDLDEEDPDDDLDI